MSTFSLVFPQQYPQSQALEQIARPRGTQQLDLPIQGVRALRVVARHLGQLRRRPVPRLVYFGSRQQFVAIAGLIRRVEGA